MKRIIVLAIVITGLCLGCRGKETSLPASMSRSEEDAVSRMVAPEGSVDQAAEPDVLGELIPGYICFEAWAVLEYEDLEVGGQWVDFLREGKVIDDAVIPWVVSTRSSSVLGAEPPYDQIRRFCIPRSEDPGFGRGPHPVSEVVVP